MIHTNSARNLDIAKLLLDYGLDVNVQWHLSEAISDEIVPHPPPAQISEILVQHVVKLNFGKLFFSDANNVVFENNRGVDGYQGIDGFQSKCVQEIRRLQDERFRGDNLTMFDVLRTKNVCQLAIYARNTGMIETINSEVFPKRFPIYASTIRRYVMKGVARNKLVKLIDRFFECIADDTGQRLPGLPVVCVYKIFEMLSNKDLHNLVTAVKFVESPSARVVRDKYCCKHELTAPEPTSFAKSVLKGLLPLIMMLLLVVTLYLTTVFFL